MLQPLSVLLVVRGPKTEHSTRSVASPVLSTGARSATYMVQIESQREKECVYNIVYYVSWFSCKNKIAFSVGRYILKLNESHKTMLLLSQQILGSNIQRDLSRVNIPSSKNVQSIDSHLHLETPCIAKVNDWLSSYFMMTNSQWNMFSCLHTRQKK